MSKPAVRAAIYCRISSDPQGLRAGVERQEKDCRKLVERRGWKVAGLFTDNDLSAWTGKERPEYRRMLDEIEAGSIEAVAVWHLDRLHRSPRELEDFVDLCQRAGLSEVATVTGDLDVNNSDGLFQARILTAVARKSSDDSSRRIRRKMEDTARAGRPKGGGKRPFGFEAGGMKVDKAEAKLVREAARRVLRGEGLLGIATDWNRRGIPTVGGGVWSTRTLKRILTSPRWAGLSEYKGAVVAEAAWPAIIDQASHEQLRALLLNPARSNGGTTARKYLLPGFVFCGLCEKRLLSRPRRAGGRGENQRSYACVSGIPTDGCGKVSIIAEPLEELVREAIFEALDVPEFSEGLRAAGAGNEQAALLQKIRDDTTALEQLAQDHYGDQLITRGEFLAARKVIEDRLEATKRKLERETRASVITSLPTGRKALERAWQERDLEWRRSLVGAVLERVDIRPAVHGRNYFDRERVKLVWRG